MSAASKSARAILWSLEALVHGLPCGLRPPRWQALPRNQKT